MFADAISVGNKLDGASHGTLAVGQTFHGSELPLVMAGQRPLGSGSAQPVRVAPTHTRKRTQSSLSAAAIILAPLDCEEINWGSALTHRQLERGSLLVQPIG